MHMWSPLPFSVLGTSYTILFGLVLWVGTWIMRIVNAIIQAIRHSKTPRLNKVLGVLGWIGFGAVVFCLAYVYVGGHIAVSLHSTNKFYPVPRNY